ncbi:MAG: YgeY family selenium metabolism-linked hydrolase [Erysipelotrichaceae bacterium]|nr:YgeY family selenium metabolism-linked hydrolase [Erysipelotrichaceae bacterium]
MKTLELMGKDVTQDLLAFTQALVRIKSYSGQEEEIITFIAEKMKSLGYDEVVIDGFGNVVGRIGNGEKKILMDSHVDTVDVKDAELWDYPPFSGEIVEGYLWGRGSVDMKSGTAASIFAAAIARSMGLIDGKTVYVSCGVFEEDCDGENLNHLLKELDLKPDYCVICEPSSNLIVTGHKGKAQIEIKAKGVSAHGSAPEKGVNAIYQMTDIIKRVEMTNLELMKKDKPPGTLVMSRISSTSVSLNAVPSECEVYLDRRMVVGDTEATIRQEMDRIIEGKNATWEIGTLYRKTWTGMDVKYDPFHLAWEIDLTHDLSKAFITAYQEVYNQQPDRFDYWDFSTNAVATVSRGIPTIGFGPGEYKLAHMRNEKCEVAQIIDVCKIYTQVIGSL